MDALAIFIIAYFYFLFIAAVAAPVWGDTQFWKFFQRIFNRISRSLEWAWFRGIRRRKDRT